MHEATFCCGGAGIAKVYYSSVLDRPADEVWAVAREAISDPVAARGRVRRRRPDRPLRLPIRPEFVTLRSLRNSTAL
jgi:hypothetical protein